MYNSVVDLNISSLLALYMQSALSTSTTSSSTTTTPADGYRDMYGWKNTCCLLYCCRTRRRTWWDAGGWVGLDWIGLDLQLDAERTYGVL